MITSLLRRLALVVPAAIALASPAGAAPRQTVDRVWTAPDLASYPLTSIALLPPATYDGNIDNRKLVETAVGQALKGTGYRWVSPFLVRDYLLKAGGDSLAKALNAKLLKDPRTDSLDAPYLSRVMHARGLLSVRVDQMERRELEAGQAGRPATTVQLKAALVDSTGRLLWTIASNETLEGQQQDADANLIGVKASGLNNQGVGNTTTAPPFPEVLTKICQRWTEAFPRRAAADSSAAAPTAK